MVGLVTHPYSPECVERLSENSGKASLRTPKRGQKGPKSTVSAPLVPANAGTQGCSNDFSDSLGREILRSSHGLGPSPTCARRARIRLRIANLGRSVLYDTPPCPSDGVCNKGATRGRDRPSSWGWTPSEHLRARRGRTRLHLRLPPGYRTHLDPDVLVLRRADGSVVARFSGRGLVAEEVERAAWEDYGDTAEGPAPSHAPSGRPRPPAARPRSVPWPPRPPS
jgi:hypothetical protein